MTDTLPTGRVSANMKMTRLIPMLPVADIGRSVEFYEKLGFAVETRRDDWRWAMLASGECRLMVDQSINGHPGMARMGIIYLYPDDIAAYHAQVRASGIEIPDLETTFYGLTEFRIDDPDGNRLWVGQSQQGT